MFPTLRLAMAQFDFPVGSVSANAKKVRDLMAQARSGDAALVLFPELTLSGYPPEDLLIRPSFLQACASELNALASTTDGIVAVLGHPYDEGELYNGASVLRERQVECTATKQ
ncbi:MAG: nitrilase-related carbon-nitrogen hydrolase, partial [Rhodanobacter sp.]